MQPIRLRLSTRSVSHSVIFFSQKNQPDQPDFSLSERGIDRSAIDNFSMSSKGYSINFKILVVSGFVISHTSLFFERDKNTLFINIFSLRI
jgi:hypothetical protein